MHCRFLKKMYLIISLCCVASISLADSKIVTTVTPILPTPVPPDIALIQKNGVLRAAFYKQGIPPFFMQDAQGNWSGIDIDLAAMIAKELGVKLVIIPADNYDEMINMVFTGKADMAMGLLSATPEREIKISFTNAYDSFPRMLLINRIQAAQYHWNTWDVVSQMEASNKPLKIGALKNGAALVTLNQVFPNAIPVPYDDLNVAMQDVAAGKIFAMVTVSPIQAQEFLKNNPRAVLTAEYAPVSNWVDLSAIALPWQYFGLRIWINAYFSYIQSNNIEAQLFAKYFPVQPEELNDAPAYY